MGDHCLLPKLVARGAYMAELRFNEVSTGILGISAWLYLFKQTPHIHSEMLRARFVLDW